MKSNRDLAIEFLAETKEKLEKMPKQETWEPPQVTLDMIESAKDNSNLIRMLAVTLHNQIIARRPKNKRPKSTRPKVLSPYNYYISQQYDEDHPGHEELMACVPKQRQKLIAQRWKNDKATYVVPPGYVLRRDRVQPEESVSAPSPSEDELPGERDQQEEVELKSDGEIVQEPAVPVKTRRPVKRLPRKQ